MIAIRTRRQDVLAGQGHKVGFTPRCRRAGPCSSSRRRNAQLPLSPCTKDVCSSSGRFFSIRRFGVCRHALHVSSSCASSPRCDADSSTSMQVVRGAPGAPRPRQHHKAEKRVAVVSSSLSRLAHRVHHRLHDRLVTIGAGYGVSSSRVSPTVHLRNSRAHQHASCSHRRHGHGYRCGQRATGTNQDRQRGPSPVPQQHLSFPVPWDRRRHHRVIIHMFYGLGQLWSWASVQPGVRRSLVRPSAPSP